MNELVNRLHDHGDLAAVLTETTSLSYRELAELVGAVATQLGVTRRHHRDKVWLRETGTGYSGCRRHGCSGALETGGRACEAEKLPWL